MRRASRSRFPDRKVNVVVRVDGSVKNDWLDAADGLGLSLSDFVRFCVWKHVESGDRMPEAAPRVLPSEVDVLRSYLSGERLLMPCGEVSCDLVVESFGGVGFCESCGLRVV